MVCVCVGGGGGVKSVGGGGINRKDPNFNYSEEFGTQKIGGEYHKSQIYVKWKRGFQ